MNFWKALIEIFEDYYADDCVICCSRRRLHQGTHELRLRRGRRGREAEEVGRAAERQADPGPGERERAHVEGGQADERHPR